MSDSDEEIFSDLPSGKPEKDFSGKLPFRSNPDTHRKIANAAAYEHKSINAWMEEVLSQAANEVLGQETVEIKSNTIRRLIEDPDYGVRLIEDVAPYLKDWNPAFVLRFNSALKKLLLGLDLVSSFLQNKRAGSDPDIPQELIENSNDLMEITQIIFPLLQEENNLFYRQFSFAFKKFLIGLAAVKPFLKDEETEHALRVLATIEALLKEIENQ